MKVTELEGTIQERERALQSARETLVDVQERVHMLQKGKEEVNLYLKHDVCIQILIGLVTVMFRLHFVFKLT